MSAGSATALALVTLVGVAGGGHAARGRGRGRLVAVGGCGRALGRARDRGPRRRSARCWRRHARSARCPELSPAVTVVNRLWPLMVLTVAAAGIGIVEPQIPAIAAGFAIGWALAWRRQASAVQRDRGSRRRALLRRPDLAAERDPAGADAGLPDDPARRSTARLPSRTAQPTDEWRAIPRDRDRLGHLDDRLGQRRASAGGVADGRGRARRDRRDRARCQRSARSWRPISSQALAARRTAAAAWSPSAAAGADLLLDHGGAAVAGAGCDLAGRDRRREPPGPSRDLAATARAAPARRGAAGDDDGRRLAGADRSAETARRASSCRSRSTAPARWQRSGPRHRRAGVHRRSGQAAAGVHPRVLGSQARRDGERLVVTGVDVPTRQRRRRSTGSSSRPAGPGRVPSAAAARARVRHRAAARGLRDHGARGARRRRDAGDDAGAGAVPGARAGPDARPAAGHPTTLRSRCVARSTRPRPAMPAGRGAGAEPFDLSSVSATLRERVLPRLLPGWSAVSAAIDRSAGVDSEPVEQRVLDRPGLLSRLRDHVRARGHGRDLHLAVALGEASAATRTCPTRSRSGRFPAA